MKVYLKFLVMLIVNVLLGTGVFFTEADAQTSGVAPTCRSLTGTLPVIQTENFDTLASTGTSSTVPAGFGFVEQGANANTTYTAGTGSSNIGDTYSFGASGSMERAFGGLRSASLTPILTACFQNNTGATINSASIAYTGEQWRLGTTGRADRLDFQYAVVSTQLTVTEIVTTTFIDRNQLDFSSPTTTGTVGALDGNNSANRTTLTNIFNVTVPNGQYFYIRWLDFDAAGSDDGLAVDDFSITFNAATPSFVGISGRVLANGNGLSGAVIAMTDSSGNIRYALSSPFGFYRFADVAAGETYVFNVSHKRFVFQPRTVNLSEQTENFDFIGTPKSDDADNATTKKAS
jgi:hypothetical protein